METVRQFSAFHLTPRPTGATVNPENAVSPWELSSNQIEIDFQSQIGKGAFSIVYKGKLIGPAPIVAIVNSFDVQMYNNCNVAVKTVPQHNRTSSTEALLEEIEFLKTFGYHPHVVSLLGCITQEQPICLVMELAQQDLHRFLHSLKDKVTDVGDFPEKEMMSTAWQIADGMCYLVSKNLIHRDLAARNVLLTRDMRAMVADFGLCRNCTDHDDASYISAAEGRLPVKWMAPESLTRQIFSQKSDVWSFGVLLYEMYTLGEMPYTDIHLEMLISYLKSGNRMRQPMFASDQIYQVMTNCWREEPADRPTFQELMSIFNEMLENDMKNHGYIQPVCGSPSSLWSTSLDNEH
uniref:Protein kinase domain-containing protein n=1 Tax=Plectus sambesii TaxID=2011161 RepID=A0A914UMC3_9BILA